MADLLVFRLGSGRRTSLENVNAASFKGVIQFAYRAIDRHFRHGDTLELWRVKVNGPFGDYEEFNSGVKRGGPSHGMVGRKKSGWGWWYSLPAGGAFTASRVGAVSLDTLGRLAGYEERGGHGGPGWWYISEIPLKDEHKAVEKAFSLRVPFE